ncbi:MAG: HdeA/HdeB family chaperone [Proteobacteria bacterium]|nr:HdeA/HdeB family chaperone [Pseudomonadota bacterium]
MKKLVALFGIICILLAGTNASWAKDKKKKSDKQDKQATTQSVDVAKCTCNDLLNEKDEKVIAAGLVWVDGYLSGKTGDTRIDFNSLKRLSDRIETYCKNNPTMPILDAVKISKGSKY